MKDHKELRRLEAIRRGPPLLDTMVAPYQDAIRMATMRSMRTRSRSAPAPMHSHEMHAHADMLHMPDFMADPGGPTHVVSGSQTFNGPMELWNVVVPDGATLTLGPSCELRVVTIFVDEGGVLKPAPGARVTFRDVPFDYAYDPDQFGHGLIVFGRIVSVGTAKTPYERTAVAPKAGDTKVMLAKPVSGWLPGDELVFGDTRTFATDDLIDWSGPLPRKKDDHTEVRHVASVSADGHEVTLGSPLSFDHPGAVGYNGPHPATGVPMTPRTIMPWVSNHTRDIVWRSENPQGVRAHSMFTERALVEFKYNQLDDMGRTTAELLDNSKWDGNTNVHVGKNQVGRYAGHCHHLYGMEGEPVADIAGNAFNRPAKWGFSLHDTHFATFQWNVCYGALGGGFVTETGQETQNVIERNFVVRTIGGMHSEDNIVGTFGTRGDGFWLSGNDNFVNHNVSVDSHRGFMVGIIGEGTHSVLRGSMGPGMDPRTPEGGFDCVPDLIEVRQFDGNEAVGALDTGMLAYNMAKISPVHVKGYTSWHCHGSWEIANVDSLRMSDVTIIGAPPGVSTARVDGIKLNQNHDFTLDGDIYIAGVRVGVSSLQPGYARLDGAMWMTIAGGDPASPGQIHANIAVMYASDRHNQPIGTQTPWRVTNRNVILSAAPTGGYPPYKQYYLNQTIDGADMRVLGQWYNENVNGKTSRVYSREQDADRPMPTTGAWTDPETGITYSGLAGSPEPGLTNAEAWEKHGIAYGGEVAPCHASDPQVYGIECLEGEPPPPHRLSVKVSATPLSVKAGGVVSLSAVIEDEPESPDDPPCPNTLHWSSDGGGTFADPAAPQTAWTAPSVGDLVTITVTVTCADGETAKDTVRIRVTAADPVEVEYTGVPTGTSTDGGKTVTVNPPSEWIWTAR